MGTSALGNGIRNIVTAILDFLPGSPFVYLEQDGAIYKIMRWFNWLVPVDFMVTTLMAWLVVVQVYQIWQVGLRWFNVIE